MRKVAIGVIALLALLVGLIGGGPGAQASTTVVLDFEGLGDQEQILDFYNGGLGGSGSGPGPAFGITFGPDALALIDADAGGSGNFANEPSADTIAFFLTGPGVVMNVLAGFTTGFSFFYTSSQVGAVTIFDGPNGTGNVLATVPVVIQHTTCGAAGDPSGTFACWTPVGVTFSGTAFSVNFGGVSNQTGFDEITLGSATPGATEIEKELLDGPEEIGIYLPQPTQYVFEIAYTGPTAAKVTDTVPAEFECVSLVPTDGTATCSDTSKGKGNSANRIEWDVPAGSNTLTVTIQTIVSPGKGHKDPVTGERVTVFKPTSCGPLPINDGATAFEVDPATGELVLVEVIDPVTGEITLEPVVIVGPSNSLVVEAVEGAKPCEEG